MKVTFQPTYLGLKVVFKPQETSQFKSTEIIILFQARAHMYEVA